jgi:hypothetical protein
MPIPLACVTSTRVGFAMARPSSTEGPSSVNANRSGDGRVEGPGAMGPRAVPVREVRPLRGESKEPTLPLVERLSKSMISCKVVENLTALVSAAPGS